MNAAGHHAPQDKSTPPAKPAPVLPNGKHVTAWGDLLSAEPPVISRPTPWGRWALFLFVWAALVLPLIAGETPAFRAFALVFTSIILEALPFMLIGSCVGGLIEVAIHRDRLVKFLPRQPWGVACLAAAMGMVFPVCECAVVPVVRRLTRKGLPLSAAVAYLLGGPIVNPITAASTLLAYKFDWSMLGLRLLGGYAIAAGVGLIMGRLFKGNPALLPDAAHILADADNHCACAHHGAAHSGAPAAKIIQVFRHAADDFFDVIHYLVIGAAIAALAQTLINRRIFMVFSTQPFAPTACMMALAILLNLCSEADAFIAASFQGLLPPAAQLAFLLTGPMFDLKLLLMYRKLFTHRAIITLALLILAAVFGMAIGMAWLTGVRP